MPRRLLDRNTPDLPEVPAHLRDDPEIKARLAHIAEIRTQRAQVEDEIRGYEEQIRTAQAVGRAIRWGIDPEVGRVIDRQADR